MKSININSLIAKASNKQKVAQKEVDRERAYLRSLSPKDRRIHLAMKSGKMVIK